MSSLNDTLKTLLLQAPTDHLDPSLRPMIEALSDPALAIELLHVLDAVVHESLGSTLIAQTLQTLYEAALVREGTTHEEVITGAYWRQV
jgi:hypothetical protein